MLWVLGVAYLHKKNCGSILKNVDFFLMSNFCQSFPYFHILLKTKKLPLKVRYQKKICNFQDIISKFFVQVIYSLQPKHTNFGAKIWPFILFNIEICSSLPNLLDHPLCLCLVHQEAIFSLTYRKEFHFYPGDLVEHSIF